MLLPQIAVEITQKLEKTDFRSTKWLMKELQRCLSAVRNCKVSFLSDIEAAQLLDLIVQVLTQFTIDKETRLDNFESQKKKLDEEDIELFEEQLEKADKVFTYAMDICGTLLKTMALPSL